MNKTRIISLATCVAGILLRLIDFSYSGLIMCVGILLLIVFTVINAIKNLKSDIESVMLSTVTVLWSVYLFERFFFFDFLPSLMGINPLFFLSLILSVFYIVKFGRNRMIVSLERIFFYTFFLTSVALSFVHSDRIFYMIKLNELTQVENRKSNYYDWDRYSWFLYLADKKTEAMEANSKVLEIVNKEIVETKNLALKRDLEFFENRRKRIATNTWNDFDEE